MMEKKRFVLAVFTAITFANVDESCFLFAFSIHSLSPVLSPIS